MKTSEPLFGCADCYEERSYPADELAWYKGQLFCEDCWAWRLYLAEEDAGLPAYEDLEPFVPEYEKEIIRLRTELKTCKSFHTVAVKERDAERRETDRLRAELERLKRQWAEDDRDITELEDENNKLLDGLAVERKKREDAERVLADWLDCCDTSEEWMRCRNNAKIVLGRDADPKSYSPAIIEVLREGLQEIVDGHCEDISGCSCCNYDVEIAKEALANLPVRAAAVEKVLEAADKWYDEWKDYGAMSLSYIELRDAIRERREK